MESCEPPRKCGVVWGEGAKHSLLPDFEFNIFCSDSKCRFIAFVPKASLRVDQTVYPPFQHEVAGGTMFTQDFLNTGGRICNRESNAENLARHRRNQNKGHKTMDNKTISPDSMSPDGLVINRLVKICLREMCVKNKPSEAR